MRAASPQSTFTALIFCQEVVLCVSLLLPHVPAPPFSPIHRRRVPRLPSLPRKVAIPIVTDAGVVTKWSALDGGRGSHTGGGNSKAIERVKNRDYDGSIYMVNKPPRWNDQVRANVLRASHEERYFAHFPLFSFSFSAENHTPPIPTVRAGEGGGGVCCGP